jgi:hypothetical protein
MKKVSIILIIGFLLCGCSVTSENRAESQTDEEETDMSKPSWQITQEQNDQWYEENRAFLLTKEEFLRKVLENEDALGVTVADFDDIDVDDFIENRKLTEESFTSFITGERIFKGAYNAYIENLPRRRVHALLQPKLRTANSTDEEYDIFKERFIERIGVEVSPWTHRDRTQIVDGVSEGFEFINVDGDVDGFTIGRTMYINQLERRGWQISEDPVWATIPYGDGTDYGMPMFISKNGKYFLLAGSYATAEFLIKTFIELDD